MCMMFSQCNTQWLYTLRYNINGSVATSRAMPTPFFFSRLSETLIVLILHHVLLPQFAVISMYYNCISLLYYM